MDRCNGHQILLDLRVKRAVNLTGGSQGSGRVRACLLVALLPALPDSELITSSGNRADVDYTGSRCWRWQAGKRWQGRSTFVLKTSHQPQLVILPCQRSTLCYHTGLFRAQIHFKTDQLRKCHKSSSPPRRVSSIKGVVDWEQNRASVSLPNGFAGAKAAKLHSRNIFHQIATKKLLKEQICSSTDLKTQRRW